MLLCLTAILAVTALTAPASANPSQDDVFKSISSNVNDQIDGSKVVAFLAATAGLIIILVLINHRQQRQDSPKVTNHQGKLLRELMKSADLAAGGEPVENLTTILLCPSLIKRARGRNAPRESDPQA